MPRKWWTLLTVCLGVFMLLLDITVVTVALPDIQRVLDASFEDLQWVIDAYVLALASFLLTYGSLADLVGRRRIFSIALSIFTLASLLCGIAQDPTALNLSRGLQGLGGSGMFATGLALIAHEFRGRDRATALGIWGGTVGMSVAVGPLIGGAITDSVGWRGIFLVNIPIGIAAFTFARLKVAESADPGATRVDWIGLITFSAGLFALIFALIRGNIVGWSDPLIVALFVAAAVLLATFVVAELKQARPMLDLGLFRKPAFTGAAVGAFALSASIFAMFPYLSLYLQNILGHSPFEAGLIFLPATVVQFLVAPAAGQLSVRVPIRLLFGAGLALIGIGLLLMHGVEADSEWTTLLAGFVLAGAGIGVTTPILASTAIGVVRAERSGMATGINNTFLELGTATGIAGLGVLFHSQVTDKVTELVGTVHVAGGSEKFGDLVAGGQVGPVLAAAPEGIRGHLVRAADTAFTTGLNEILLAGALLALVGAGLTLILVRRRDFVHRPEGAAEAAPVVAG